MVTCSPFPFGPPLAGLLWLGFLCLLPSFIIVVASCVFVLLLSKVIVLLVAAEVICSSDTEGIQALTLRRSPAPGLSSVSMTTASVLPAESFLDLDSFSSDSSLQRGMRRKEEFRRPFACIPAAVEVWSFGQDSPVILRVLGALEFGLVRGRVHLLWLTVAILLI